MSEDVRVTSPNGSARRPRSVYSMLTGQYDNVGDAMLRRAMVHHLDALGEWHVFVGNAPGDYIESLRLRQDMHLYRSRTKWLVTATRGMTRRDGAVLVVNPGEISSSGTEFLLGLASSWLLLLGRLRGNPGIRVGVGARERRRPLSLGHEIATRLARVNIWRDALSRELFRRGTVAPDWAFALPAAGRGSIRPYVALSYRSDKALPSQSALRAIREWAEGRGLQLLVVSQVRRDVERHGRLAASLGARHIGDVESSLEELEAAARSAYAGSVAVVSNRIHALILGMLEGAAPAALLGHPDVKVARTLRAAGIDAGVLSEPDRPEVIAEFLDAVVASRESLAERIIRAREDLESISRALIASGGTRANSD